jgi:hypothetical protein
MAIMLVNVSPINSLATSAKALQSQNQNAANATMTEVEAAPVDIPTVSDYSQNFDGIGTTATATLPSDLRLDRPGTVRTVGTYSAATTVTTAVGGANLATNAANGAYNFGSGTGTTGADRAIAFFLRELPHKAGISI